MDLTNIPVHPSRAGQHNLGGADLGMAAVGLAALGPWVLMAGVVEAAAAGRGPAAAVVVEALGSPRAWGWVAFSWMLVVRCSPGSSTNEMAPWEKGEGGGQDGPN